METNLNYSEMITSWGMSFEGQDDEYFERKEPAKVFRIEKTNTTTQKSRT